MIDVEKYLFAPYVPGGREMAGFDCWGLTLLVRREMGLPELENAPSANRENAFAMQKLYSRVTANSVECVATPLPGDIAAVFKARVLVHVAVAVSIGGRIALLETNPGSGVRWMFLDQFLKTYYQVAFYRDRSIPKPP